MTALLITEIFPPKVGGSGRWLWEVYRRLPPELFVVAAGECLGAEDFDQALDLRLFRFPLTLPSWGIVNRQSRRSYWRLYRTLLQLVRREKVSGIQCGKCLPEGLLALALKWRTGLPYSCFIHGEELTLAADSRELRFLTSRVLASARMLTANSRNTARLLTDEWGVQPSRISVLHPGVDTTQFVPAPPDARVRARLGWEGRRVVLTVGRLVLRKGQDMMIRALASVRQQIPDVLYAVVGDGEEREHLAALADAEGVRQHVQFLGEIPDREIIECYQQCDLFALPNRQVGADIEGFGMVLLEAQACGRPVLAGKSGGTVETLEPGVTGVVVPCEAPEPLAATIAELLGSSDRLSRMGEAGRLRAVEHFDWGSLARQAKHILFDARPSSD
jgi:phosphatidylinositol alpha-1,6-mannosyltransferase